MSTEQAKPVRPDVPRAAADEPVHWLVKPENIRKLWWGFTAVLALTVLAQLVFKVKGYFGIDEWFGFGAVYGFVSCAIMVVVAKALGFVLKRDEQYYDDALKEDGDDA